MDYRARSRVSLSGLLAGASLTYADEVSKSQLLENAPKPRRRAQRSKEDQPMKTLTLVVSLAPMSAFAQPVDFESSDVVGCDDQRGWGAALSD